MRDGDEADTGTGREAASFVEYGIEDRPPLGTSVLLGFQHYLTMIGASVAISLVLATTMGMPDWATARLIGTFFVVSGIATLAQTTSGTATPSSRAGRSRCSRPPSPSSSSCRTGGRGGRR